MTSFLHGHVPGSPLHVFGKLNGWDFDARRDDPAQPWDITSKAPADIALKLVTAAEQVVGGRI